MDPPARREYGTQGSRIAHGRIDQTGSETHHRVLPIELVVRFSVANLLSYEESLEEFKVAEDSQECADEIARRRARI